MQAPSRTVLASTCFDASVFAPSCQSLHDKLKAAEPEEMVAGLGADPMQRLGLLRVVLDAAAEAGDLDALDVDHLESLILQWVEGRAESELIAESDGRWNQILSLLENTLPWYISGAIEILGFVTGCDRSRRDQAHRDFGTARVRYGAPDLQICKLIRGASRGIGHWAVQGLRVDRRRPGRWRDPRYGQRLLELPSARRQSGLRPRRVPSPWFAGSGRSAPT